MLIEADVLKIKLRELADNTVCSIAILPDVIEIIDNLAEKQGPKKDKPTSKEIDNLFEAMWKMYPNKKGKAQVSKSKKKELYQVGPEEIERCINRYLKELKKDEWRKPQNGSTFFNTGYVDYLDVNYIGEQNATTKSNGGYCQI